MNVEHVLTIMTVLGAAVAAARVFIPDENLVFCPERTLTQGKTSKTQESFYILIYFVHKTNFFNKKKKINIFNRKVLQYLSD